MDLEKQFGIGNIPEIKRRFMERLITDAKLAKWLGVSQMTLFRWFNGYTHIPVRYETQLDNLYQEILRWEKEHGVKFNHSDRIYHISDQESTDKSYPKKSVRDKTHIVTNDKDYPDKNYHMNTSFREALSEEEYIEEPEIIPNACPYGAKFGLNYGWFNECEFCVSHTSCEDWAREYIEEWEEERSNK